MSPATPELSIVVPFFNESGAAAAVVRELDRVLAARGGGYEIILVDDASTDGTGALLRRLAEEFSACRVIELARNSGQGAALWQGLHAARAPVLGMLDGDGQNDPADLPALLALLDGADLVVGLRSERHDSALRRAMSRVANAVRRRWLHDGVHDAGCALKVFRRELLGCFAPIRMLHPFMPAFAVAAGFRVAECPVRHRPRLAGESKYGLGVLWWRPFFDMLAVGWMARRRIPPARAQEVAPPPSARL